MLLWYLPDEYLLGMGIWLAVMGATVVVLLKLRRASKTRPVRLGLIHAGLSLWMFLSLVTAIELYFALFVDRSDSFNRTNISKRWIHRHIDAQKNRVGYRDAQDLTPEIPDGMKRIMFFGDSFTAGQGIPRREDRFSELLRADLDRTRPGKVQVANFGELGLEVVQITGRIEGVLTEGYEANTVVYVYMLNDIEGFDPKTIEVMQNLGRFDPQWFVFRNTYFLNWLYFRSMQYRHKELRDYFPHLVDAYRSDSWNGVARKLDELHSICRKRNVDFRMAIYPFVHNLGPDYPFRDVHRRLVDYCKSRGIKVLDLEPVLSPHAGEGLVVNRFDAHPNERANALVAEAMRTQLLADYFAEPAAEESKSPKKN
jgi:hypothetical protein